MESLKVCENKIYSDIVITQLTSEYTLVFSSFGSITHVKVGCIFLMVVVSILSHVEFGQNDHWKDAPQFTCMKLSENSYAENRYSIKRGQEYE